MSRKIARARELRRVSSLPERICWEFCVLIDLPLNYANIIALPLLLGVGVAFKIYYIMAWREGQTNLLQSVLTRAVMFSAATTATAFGSLFFSSHPGTSSMGELLALSLVSTLAAAALFQPILMGKPRKAAENKELTARATKSGSLSAAAPDRLERRACTDTWILHRPTLAMQNNIGHRFNVLAAL